MSRFSLTVPLDSRSDDAPWLINILRSPILKQKQSDGGHSRGGSAIKEDRRMSDAIPELSCDDAGDEPEQAGRRGVPSDSARAERRGHEIGRERLADRSEYPLVDAVDDEAGRDRSDVPRQPEAGIRGGEDDER